MSNLNVSIIEAEGAAREALAKLCAESGWKPKAFASIVDFTEANHRKEHEVLIVSLVEGAGADETDPGLTALRAWRESHPQTQLILLVPNELPSQDRLALIVGARHILHKPYRDDDLVQILAAIGQGVGRRARRSALESRVKQRGGFEEIIGVSAPVLDVIELARKVAVSDTTSIMITGECGTGKGALAKAMHLASPRSDGPFIEVNCAAIPRNLLESEFFGHEPGAFTDAKGEKMGLFECANGGTIFLDEVGEIDYSLQAKLLKFLDSRMIWRLGGTRFLPVDVRVVSASNRDLRAAVQEKRFREDLFYRLNVVEIRIPPLRERVADIRPIATTYAAKFAARMNKGEVNLSEEAIEALEHYTWPGNIRELINVIERAVLLNASGVVEPGEFPFTKEEREIIRPLKERGESIVIDLPPDGVALEAVEKALIVAALARAEGKITRAAGLLRVGRGTLRYKMKKYGIDAEASKQNLQNGSFEPSTARD
ncbi:MAG TPA: sigma-54 dependent transcriptional regulator [Candidatus Bathyarchaeia archaeon]|nr:sigma-54 dependent transcriptional regulator [Candidatus Bathyarchaeia archaeon]